MPVLIVAFAVGAYGFGSALRGSDVIVNEVAIVRGAPDATEGTAQVYLGVFSPTRGTYQLSLPGGALLSSPVVGDFFGGDRDGALDVLQGDPARVRDLAVGFGSLRTVRAETPVAVPLIQADLRLVDGVLEGQIKNASTTSCSSRRPSCSAATSRSSTTSPQERTATVNAPIRAEPVRPAALGQALRPGVLQRYHAATTKSTAHAYAATRSSTS